MPCLAIKLNLHFCSLRPAHPIPRTHPMRIADWIDDLLSPRPRSQKNNLRRQVTVSPSLERLEDRCLLATFAVENLNDSGAGSLRIAVANANNMPGADTIVFSSALLNTSTRTI